MKLKVKEFRPGYPISFNNLTKTFISTLDRDLAGLELIWDTEQKEIIIKLKEKVLHVPQTNVAFYETFDTENESSSSETSSSGEPKTRAYKTAARG